MRYLLFLFPYFLPFIVFAQTPAGACAPGTYRLLAPVGGLTECLTLTAYLSGVFYITIGIAGVLAVVMIVICGIQMMMSGSVAGKSAAKECIWNALFGLLIALGAYAILYTINPELLRNDIALIAAPSSITGTQKPGTIQRDPTTPGCYFRYKEISSGNVRFMHADTCEACERIRTGSQADPDYEIQTNCFLVGGTGSPSTPPTTTTAPPATTGIKCPQSGRNLCEPQFRQCTNGSCAQFAGMANSYGGRTGVANGAALIKAIIIQESSCGQNLFGPVTQYGQACGPTQFLTTTANKFRTRCGLSENTMLTCGWLADKANWDKAVCLTAEYIRTISQSSCGSEIRNIAAGYNAGPGRCSNSANCAGDQSCAGGSVRQWECLYDDNAHSVCNAGFVETRNYATQVLYCTQNPGY